MLIRYMRTIAVALLCGFTFTGCPMQGSSVAGVWAIEIDPDCDEMDEGYYLIVLYSNGIVEFLGAQLYGGTWELTGSTVNINMPNAQDTEWELTGTLDMDVISNGTFTIDGMGNHCWVAERAPS